MTGWKILVAAFASLMIYGCVIHPVITGAWRNRWWIYGVPVLWLRRTLCRAGRHDDGERISTMHPFDHCLRCGERITR